MGKPTVLLYGHPDHPGLQILHSELAARARQRVAFVTHDQFPTRAGLFLDQDGEKSVLIPDGQEPIAVPDLVSVCLDGYYIDGAPLSEFPPEDVDYIQTESWATLIAFFHIVSQRSLVANHVVLRDHLSNRWSELSYLASFDLPVPRVLVTSEPDEVEAFADEVESVVFKPVSALGAIYRELDQKAFDEIEKITTAPVHFEEGPSGEVVRCVVVGPGVITIPQDAEPPEEILANCLAACANLDLHLAEVTLRRKGDRWLASGIQGFISAEMLEEPAILGPAVSMLERGQA